jgi:glyoxylase-like metal-dependent hydrolase (beta-lactamase superfamily II)
MIQAGDITIHFLNAGFWWDDGGAQFGIVPRELWEKEKPANARHRIRMSLTCPLIITGREVILVDTGIGNRLSEREQQIYTPEPGDGLVGGLRRLGLTLDSVTHVVFSHLHFDHVGGVIDKSSTGKIRSIFTKARFLIQKQERDIALAPTDERLAAAYRHAPECLNALQNIELLNGDAQIFPHVRVAVSGGHADFHQCVIVENGGTGLIHFADIVPTTSHLRLAWNAAYDTNPLATIAAKKRFYAEARSKNLWVSFSHDDKVAAGLLDQESGKAPQLIETVSVAPG